MIKLYTYYRSTAAYRVRIALNYKNIEHELIPINLLEGKQLSANYAEINPQMRVPTLVDENVILGHPSFVLGQSLAILEYLEEKYPQFPLLPEISLSPDNRVKRAKVRSIAQLIVCDMHPLNNVGVLKYLKENCSQDQEGVNAWYHHWLKKGFDALDKLLIDSDGNFCVDNQLTMADICLIPQIYNALRFDFPMDNYPKLWSIYQHCLELDAFDKAKPENQADALSVDLSK